MKTIFKISILFLIISFNINSLYSCTTFCIHTEDELVFGKNYDWMIGYGIVFVNKKDVIKTAFTEKAVPVEWVSKYGSITFNQFGKEFPMGGINEKGLVVELMWLDETKYPAMDDRPTTGGILQWIQYQLDNSETVQEIIESDSKIRIPEGSIPVHYLVADKSGNCASIEFLDGKLVYHTKETMMYKTLTNDTYQNSIDYLKKHSEFGGIKLIENNKSSLNRFVKACSMIKDYTKTAGRSAVEYGFQILDDVDQDEHTKWSIIYDIKNMKTYFKTLDKPEVKNVDLSLINFNCSSPETMIDMNSDFAGNINSNMINYTYEANRKLIEESYNGVEFLKNIPKESRDRAAEYPQKLDCRSKSGIDPGSNTDKSDKNFIPPQFLIFTGIILTSVILVLKYKVKKRI